jgi:molybdopterin synthase sulfur carrier subunit
MTPTIEIRLFATLRRLLPASADNYPIDPGMSLSDLLDKLKIPRNEAKLIFINGRRADQSSILNDGDRVGIFPPVGGG